MRDGTAPIIKLSDYKVSDFLIETVELDIHLDPSATNIRSKLLVKPNPKGAEGAALVLDGDELQFVSASINSRELSPNEYTVTSQKLVITSPPCSAFILEIVTKTAPEANTKLMGLYRSNGIYCTQCEAEGFRRITYFLDRPDVMSIYKVRLEAAKKDTAVLLSNGNPGLKGDVSGTDRHFAIWNDPHPKPAYLFALVAGNLGSVTEHFVTSSGRKVDLNVYVETGKEPYAAYAMDALKRSMKWDEDVFGCEYDLDVFNIVAVSDFNMGAMENKGLNIFNDKYILATPETATDMDYANIEAIVAHEYFHNWTGNRITCRDWFQLCLKEGLTVFRDQEFSSDMRSRSVKRIEDVIDLRDRQFGEDAGPLAHPVRPEAYSEINNFYTATIYEKGAELIRMLKQILGAPDFKKGMDLYLERCDGTAATIEEFIACFAEVSNRDLSNFFVWYGQAGTPDLNVTRHYDAKKRILTLNFVQNQRSTPGQPTKNPVVIPIALALIKPDGFSSHNQVFILDKARSSLELNDADADSVPSLLREFSAPVILKSDLSDADYGILAQYDTDSFNRWQSIQTLSLHSLITHSSHDGAADIQYDNQHIISAFQNLLGKALVDPAFTAFSLKLPSLQEIARGIATNVNPDAVFAARKALEQEIGQALLPQLLALQLDLQDTKPFVPDAAGAGLRSLKAIVLAYIQAACPATARPLLLSQFATAHNMTEKMSSLSLLSRSAGNDRENALSSFEKEFSNNALVLDKWLAVNASIPEIETLERIKRLMNHSAYSKTNPNRIRALIGTFAFSNFTQFNRVDGEGYRFIAQSIIEIDAVNPQVSARMATAFRTWRTLEPVRRNIAEQALRMIESGQGLSIDLKDILQRTLA